MPNPFNALIKAVATTAFVLDILSNSAQLEAQTVTTLHSFGTGEGFTPLYGLTLGPDGTFYGTCYGNANPGGAGGTVFRMNPDGSGFSVIHTFNNNGSSSRSNVGGANPIDGPIFADGLLYGVTYQGGANYFGVLYSMTTNGSSYTPVWQISEIPSTSVALPYCGIVQGSDGFFYGGGGVEGINNWKSVIYKIDTNGNNYASLYYTTYATAGYAANAMTAGHNGNLYGVTQGDSADGPTTNDGTVFMMTTGGVYTVLHNLAGNDGELPIGTLMEDTNGALYGTAAQGGVNGEGTAFRIGTNGTAFTILHQFGSVANDGTIPQGRLLLATDGNLYGTTVEGGADGYGTIFRMGTNGANYQVIYSFTGNVSSTGDHGYPNGCLVEAGNGLIYGMNSDQDFNNDPIIGNGSIFVLNAGLPSPGGIGISGITRVDASPTNLNSVQWTVTFAATVTGVSTTNFQLVATGLAGSPAITSVSGSGTAWTVTASTGTGSGTLQLNLNSAAGLSSAITNTLPYDGPSYSIDLVPPTITIGSPSVSITSTGMVAFTITYADANFNTCTLAASNVTLNTTGTATAHDILISPIAPATSTTHTVTLTDFTGEGTIGISIAAGTANDLAGNLAPAAGPSTAFTVALAPQITVQPTPQAAPALGYAAFSVTATGTAPLVYQWSKDSAVLTTATNYAALNLTNVNRASVGYYSVTVSNAVGLVTSTNVLLRVLIPQKFSQVLQPRHSYSTNFAALFQDTNGTVATLWYATNFFQVLGSTNLPADWEPVSGAMSLTNGFILFQDNDPTNVNFHPYRFYRIEEQ